MTVYGVSLLSKLTSSRASCAHCSDSKYGTCAHSSHTGSCVSEANGQYWVDPIGAGWQGSSLQHKVSCSTQP